MPRVRRLSLIALALLLVISGVVWAAPPQQQIDNFSSFTSALRADLEVLAEDTLGAGNRPENWTANIDRTTQTYVSDLWFDKELLANELYQSNERPPEWFGLTEDVAEIIARNVRHDVELLADEQYGFDVRPPAWNGASQRYRCERTLQNAFALLGDFYGYQTNTPDDAFGFCTLIGDQVTEQVLDVQQLDLTGEALNEAILAVRGDIERIANEVYGVNDRPIGWSGNTDVTSALLLTDNYADIDILAEDTLEGAPLPDGWIGLRTESRVETWRNQRHDLELLANVVVPTLPTIEGDRPRGWQGTDPLRQCDVIVQELVLILEANYQDDTASFSRTDVEAGPGYCNIIRAEANSFAENPPLTEAEQLLLAGLASLTFEAEFAFAYLDPAALEYMGSMPLGTQFRPWYRNYGDSTMMFVSGQDFAVYIDRRWTTMPQDVFDGLPTIEGVRPLTFCDADWCNGPGPTPTPTGGALESLLLSATLPAAPTADPNQPQLNIEDKTQVNFLNIDINYLQDDEVNRTARVTLRLCQSDARIECEPVTRVFDEAANAPKAVISQFNGQNVYEFTYGYQSNLIIESATLISRDIFIEDPTTPRD